MPRVIALSSLKRIVLCAGLLMAVPATAYAQTITFDNLVGLNGQTFSSYTEAGFDVDLLSGAICGAQAFGNPVPSLFGGFICNSTTASLLRIRRTGGGLFNFSSTDLATQNGSSTYMFTGFLASVATYSVSNSFSTNALFANFAGPNPTSLIDELQIALNTTTASTYNIDNIQLATTTTPEPATLALVGMGVVVLAGGGAVRRRREN